MTIYMAVPHTRPFEGEFVDSLVGSAKIDGSHFARLPNHAVDVSRNLLTNDFLNNYPDLKYILFMDSDATWAPEAMLRLASYDLPVVTACIYKRGLPPVPTFGKYLGIDKDGWHSYHFGWAIQKIMERVDGLVTEETLNALCLPEMKGRNDLLEIDGCGLHFCMIRRDVMQKITPPWFKAEIMGAGEDFYFCRKVKEAGYKIYADLSTHTGHIIGAGFDYGLREMLAFIQYTGKIDIGKEVWGVGLADLRFPS